MSQIMVSPIRKSVPAENLNLCAIDVTIINHNGIYTLVNIVLPQYHCKC